MPPQIKHFQNKDVLLISTRTEEGLPFISASFMKAIIMGHLARAQFLTGVRVCHFIVMGNHIHMIVVVDNPDDIPRFIGRVKTELGHAVNNLLGNRKKTVWCDGYDSPVILEPERIVEDIAYLYANPAQADLVNSIDEYPGLSSWQMYQNKETTVKAKWIQRPTVKELRNHNLSIKEQDELRSQFLKNSKEEFEFKLDPNAWLDAFGLTDEAEEWNEKIVKRVREKEQECKERRAQIGKSVLGVARLRRATIKDGLRFQPQKFSQKMYVRCWDIDLRKNYLAAVKRKREQGREVLKLWRTGDRSVPYPPGLFPPCFPKISNALRETWR